MTGLFAFSYAILSSLVVLEALLLREALRGTMRLERLLADFGRRDTRQQLPIGMLAPEFSAPVLGTGRTLRTSDLKGRSTILVFVSTAEAESRSYQKLAVGIHALWHKAEGNLYLVCNGAEEECRRFAADHHLGGFGHDEVKVVLDEGARIARSFLITGTPQAVELDYDARVARYGRPEPPEEVADARRSEPRN